MYIFTLWAKDAYVASESATLVLVPQPAASSRQPRAVSGLGLALLFGRAGRPGRPTSPPCLQHLRPRQKGGQPGKEREKDGVRARSGALRHWGHRWSRGRAGRRAPWRTLGASLNSRCRNAHLHTSFCRTGRKRNNGARGKGRERRTPTHKPKLISDVYYEITAEVLWAPLLPLAGEKRKVWFAVSLASSYTIFHKCFIKHTDQKIQIPKPDHKGLLERLSELMQLRHVSKCLC